jgi:hypothetical protein
MQSSQTQTQTRTQTQTQPMTTSGNMNKVSIGCTPQLKEALEEILKEATVGLSSQEVNNNNNDKDHAVQNGSSTSDASNVNIKNLELILANAQNADDTLNPIPLNAVTIAKAIAAASDTASASASTPRTSTITSLQKLNQALERTQLEFSKPPKPPKSQVYQTRIVKLKLAEQERNYTKLTKNIHHAEADDATIQSMMYAASVGANMIVAPISIGVLMYFFAGKLFSFITPGYQPEPGKINIRGVIAGVIAGVLMLFIEMILFVIRNHEMDKFITKKMKKHKNPFGYDKETANRTYQGDLG